MVEGTVGGFLIPDSMAEKEGIDLVNWRYPGFRYYWAGTKAYDALAKLSGEGIESSYFLTRGKALEAFPMLKREKLCGALVYYGIYIDLHDIRRDSTSTDSS